jgi:hypothetical protein
MTKDTSKLLKKCSDMFTDLQCIYDLSEHSTQVQKLNREIKRELGETTVITKLKKTAPKKKKTNWKDDITEHYLDLFDSYPELNILPVYSWGRYYKYESAGRPFECCAGERGFIDFMCDINNGEKLKDKMDEELLERIDEEKDEDFDGYLPNREEVVKEFGGDDDRGGKCLVIIKNKTKTGYHYSLEAVDCDSPE